MRGVKPSRFAVALVDLQSNPPPSLIATFLLGLLLFAVIGGFLYDVVAAPDEVSGSMVLRVALTILVLAALAYVGLASYLKDSGAKLIVSEHSTVPPVPYVVSGLAPYQEFPNGQTNLDNVTRLFEHHRSRLQQVFLVAILKEETNGAITITNRAVVKNEGVLRAYDELCRWLDDQDFNPRPLVTLLDIIDSNGAEDSFNRVTELLETLLAQKLDMTDVAIDVTAGTKAMSVGLTAAALTYGCKLSYQATKRDSQGQPDFSAPERETSMVLLDSRYLLARSFKTVAQKQGGSSGEDGIGLTP